MNESEASIETPSKEIVIELESDGHAKQSKEDGKGEVCKEDSKNLHEDVDLNESEDDKPEVKPKDSSNFVEKKYIKYLNEDEKNIIINNFKNGIDQPYYDVKAFKNGSFKIIKKKEQKPSTAQKVIANSKSDVNPSDFALANETPQKVYYSDNQLLFEHIIELNSKIDRLTAKHKKLKKRYLDIQSDLYVDESDVAETVKEEAEESVKDQVKEPVIVSSRSMNSHVQPVNRSWRSRISYL